MGIRLIAVLSSPYDHGNWHSEAQSCVYQILAEWCLKMSPWTNFCKFLEFKNRSASHVEEVVAFVSHASIPDFGIGFPGVAGKLVGIGLNVHELDYKRVIFSKSKSDFGC
jgi:hypothetical protein